jgi:acetamidase/formamidase
MDGHSIHRVHANAYHQAWDRSLEPALEIEPGNELSFTVRDASDQQLGPESTSADVAALDFARVNPVSGPVFVKGAQPGDALEVEILEFDARDWGWTAIIPGFGLLADEFSEPWLRISRVDPDRRAVVFSDAVTLPYEPFPGTIGVAPPEPGPHSIVPPRRWGGNMDIKHLRAGTTLLLPVGVEGALFSVGDTHAAMGDAEVCGTAVETAMDITLKISLRRNLELPAPQYRIPAGELARTEQSAYHVCTGVAADLMEATRAATRALIAHLVDVRGLDRREAYALCSVAADLRIHEVVDAPNWLVGAFIPDDIFTA